MSNDYLFAALFAIALGFGGFILCLQIAYGWFKIKDRIKNQQEIIRLLKKVAGEQ